MSENYRRSDGDNTIISEKSIGIPHIIFSWVLFFVILKPLTIFFAVVTLPYKLYLIATRKTQPESKMKVHTVCPQGAIKDDLLFIHGWPDTGELWEH